MGLELIHDKSAVTVIYVSYRVSASLNTGIMSPLYQGVEITNMCNLTVLLISIVLESHWRASSTRKIDKTSGLPSCDKGIEFCND